jgi:uncharacterized membrane protein
MKLAFDVAYDWAHLILRWFHVMAGISWIGSSLFLLYLGRQGARRSEPQVVRELGLLAETAPWFKRESRLTWLSGVLLLFPLYLGFDLAGVSNFIVIVVVLALGWILYDRLWRWNAGGVSALLLAAAVWGLSRVHEDRLLYIELGSLLGTLMAGNVWFRIAPALAREGDAAAWAIAAQRSAHNNYLIFPVVALMVANHVPGIYGARYGAAILVILIAAFGIARHVVHGKLRRAWALYGMAALLAAMMLMTGL